MAAKMLNETGNASEKQCVAYLRKSQQNLKPQKNISVNFEDGKTIHLGVLTTALELFNFTFLICKSFIT